MPAEIAPVGTGQLEAKLAHDIVLRARPLANGAVPTESSIGFRPMDVSLVLGGEGAEGVVTRSLYLGDVAHYTIRSGPLEITAHGRPSAKLAEGSKVRWRVPPERCLVLRE